MLVRPGPAIVRERSHAREQLRFFGNQTLMGTHIAKPTSDANDESIFEDCGGGMIPRHNGTPRPAYIRTFMRGLNLQRLIPPRLVAADQCANGDVSGKMLRLAGEGTLTGRAQQRSGPPTHQSP